MANKLQLTNNTNSPRTPKQGFQLLKYPSSFANDSLQSHSAPGSPVQPSPKGRLNNQSVGLALSPSSNSSSLLPLRMRTENNDNQRPDLFNMRSHTEGSNTEEYLTTQSDVENLPRQDSKKSFGKSDTKNGKRSKSAKKIVKCPSPVSRSLGLWAKENIAEGTIMNAKDMTRLKKRTRSSVEKINKSVGGESLFNSEKKRFQSSLDVDLGINDKNNAEEEGIQGLFEEENVDREGLSRETGPIRYSKMSEEDAATMFEIRRKELLSFLMKLGSSSAVAKKKLTYNKNAGLFKQNMPTGQSSDMGKLDFPTGKALRRLQDSLKRSISPTQFIIYNTATDPMWNNNANSQAGKFATPAKDKKLTNSMKVGCESAPDGKLRNSAQFLREKEELNPLVERNLEASFNQLFEWSDTADKRSPMKMLKRTETTIRSNNDEKIDGIESITIDLTKASKSKKKKSKKVKNDQEKAVVAEKVTLAKQLSEDMGGSSVWEQSEIIVDKPSQKAITELRKKNQAVLNEIDEIDGQIERMKEIDNRQSLSQRRVYDNDDLQKEQMRKVFDEDSQEGYLLAAKVKKNAERSRSLSLKFALKENSKNNESMQEANTRGGPKSKENVREGSQSRRNQKVRFAGDANENSHISVTNVEVAPVETKEKTLVRVPSQTNTLKFDLTKNKSEQSKDRQTPVPKRALSNNPANGARKGLQEMNLNMPMNAVKDNTKDLKLKTLELGKGSVSLNQSFNTRTSQTTTNKTSEKNRLITDFSNIQTKENQQSAQQLKKKISKTYETNSTLQTVREHLLTTPSPKELVFSLRKTPTVGQKPETPLYRREPSNSSMSSKTLLNYKKPSNSSLPSKNNIRSVSDKDYSADTFQIPNLFESHSTTSIHESISPGPKIPFTKEIKRIVKEEPKEEKPTAAVLRQKSSKSKENIKTIKDVQIKPKKGDANRPTFSIANSAADLRSKIFRRQNQENSLLKPSLSPNHSKLEIKQAVHEDLGMSSSFSKTKPLKKSETDKNNLRKGSLSTPRGFRLLSSPAGQGACLAMSLQDLKEKLAQRPCTETSEDMESLDSFRLREKSLNLPLHPNQGVRQNEDMDSQELMKDSQGLKRKKAAGYSIC